MRIFGNWILFLAICTLVTTNLNLQDRSQTRSMVISRNGIVAAESPLAAQATAHGVEQHAVNAGGGKNQSEPGEAGKLQHIEALRRDGLRNHLVHAHRVDDWKIGSDLMDGASDLDVRRRALSDHRSSTKASFYGNHALSSTLNSQKRNARYPYC